MADDGEHRRQQAVARTGLMDSPPEGELDDLTYLAKRFLGTDIALFTVLDDTRQWFKSRQGTDVTETPRSVAFCHYALDRVEPLIIEDATLDPRFRDNPLVTGEPNIRFYAGVPVRDGSGFVLGTLCVLHSKPKTLSPDDLQALKVLGRMAEAHVHNRSLQRAAHLDTMALSAAITRVQNTFLSTEDNEQTFELALDDVLSVTGARYGVIGEVIHDHQGAQLLVHAITNLSWSDASKALYDKVRSRGMLFNNLDNLLGAPIIKGEVIVSDSVKDDDRAGGLPEGHPELTNYIGIPLYSGVELVGLLSLANHPTGFSLDMANELLPLTTTLGTLIERNRLWEERRQYQAELNQAANFDPLTGLPNRRRFNRRFDQMLSQVPRQNGALTVCFLDLDGFKAVNDSLGHAAGDRVLLAVANRLSSITRGTDLLARLSGDEFALVLTGRPDDTILRRYLSAIVEPIQVGDQSVQISASIGVTTYPDDYSDRDILIRHADRAMYDAKDAGKNQIRHYDTAHQLAREKRNSLKASILTALDNIEFELHLQPQVALDTGKLKGYEALLRWRHPESGILLPGSFLPEIEGTDAEQRLEQWVVSEALRILRVYSDTAGHDWTLSVNVSARYYLNVSFLKQMESFSLLPESHRRRLCLEVVESASIEDLDRALAVLEQCRSLNIGVSLDDFGTGYSSLSHLRRLPCSEVKIDMSFIQGMLTNTPDRLLVEAIVQLGATLNKTVVAEGIENEEQRQLLMDMGCRHGQGFLIGQPVPVATMLGEPPEASSSPND